MSRVKRYIIFILLPILLGCASSRPKLDSVQAHQASLRENILQLEERVERLASHIEEMEKRIYFLEGNLTANIADLQKSVDDLGEELKSQESETKKELEAVSAEVEAKLQAMEAEKKELLKEMGEARKSSYMTGYEHVVESGQTLEGIARSYGVTVEAIVEANDLEDPDTLKVGQELFIPK